MFVAAELFHLQLIPLSFLLTIVNSIKGIPLSPSYEMFFTLLIFEILNESYTLMNGVGDKGGYHAAILFSNLLSRGGTKRKSLDLSKSAWLFISNT